MHLHLHLPLRVRTVQKDSASRKKQRDEQLKNEEQLIHSLDVWKNEILPNWDSMCAINALL